jgi:hypothetical protein
MPVASGATDTASRTATVRPRGRQDAIRTSRRVTSGPPVDPQRARPPGRTTVAAERPLDPVEDVLFVIREPTDGHGLSSDDREGEDVRVPGSRPA